MPDAPIAQNRPAQHPDCAVFACDAGHLRYALVAALRIAEAEPERRFDICIATPDIEALPAACLDGPVRFFRLDPAVLPRITHPNPRITLGTFYRHFLPRLMQSEYRALLYMDTDTFLERPGIQGLFDRLGPVPVAAALNFVEYEHLNPRSAGRSRRSGELLRDLGAESGRYFQSGVLAIDTARFVAEGIGERVLDFAVARQDLLHKHGLGDQAAMNGACADLMVPLSPLWNWHNDRWLRRDLVERFKPHIVHFTGMKKPWIALDDPFVGGYNARYFTELRRLDPGFTPETRRRSLADLTAHPRTGIPPIDAAHRAVRRGVLGLRAARQRSDPAAVAWMQARIDAAEVA